MALSIKGTLRQNGRNNPEDVLSVKKALHREGYYDIPEYGLTLYPDSKLFDGIKKYQKANNLKIDGVMHPDGETIAHMNGRRRLGNVPGVKTPTIWCPVCGGPHGGSRGDLCPDCDSKT